MNTLLIHLAGASASLAGADDERRAATWHPQAEVRMGETDPSEDARRVGQGVDEGVDIMSVVARAGPA
jgi:hypothetical protein